MKYAVIILLLIMGCSSVDLQEGTFKCSTQTDCPSDWFCRADHLCYSTVGSVNSDAMAEDDAGDTEDAEVDSSVDSSMEADAEVEVDAEVDSGVVVPEACDTPDTRRCDGITVQACDGTQWTDEQTCPHLCIGEGECYGVCEPGTNRCSTDNGTLPPSYHSQTCNPQGQWVTVQSCTGACMGDGLCVGVCIPTATRCSNLNVQTCNAQGLWATSEVCADDSPCGSGFCGGCPAGAKRCTGTGPNSPSERCYFGAWDLPSTCDCLNGSCLD